MTLIQIKDASALRLSPAIEFKLAGDQSQAGVFAGYASVWGVVDSYGEMTEPGCFATSLAQHKSDGTMPALLWSHDPAKPIGRLLEAVEDDIGLRVRGKLNLGSESGDQAHKHIKAGDAGGLSFGFHTRDRDGAVLLAVDLFEISVVTMPANRRARIVTIKQAESLAEYELQIRSHGYSRADARRLAMRGWASTPDLQPLADRADRALAELKNLKGLFR
jgi:uncharacterized protein